MTPKEFKEVSIRFRPRLLQTAIRYLGDAEEAEDTVQDVLLHLWQISDQLKKKPDGLAMVLTRNFCVDKIRNRKTIIHGELPHDIIEEPVDEELLERTMNILKTLPFMQQTIIRLRHMEGMEMKDIAELTGSTEVAVRKTLSRARKAIAQKVLSNQKK